MKEFGAVRKETLYDVFSKIKKMIKFFVLEVKVIVLNSIYELCF